MPIGLLLVLGSILYESVTCRVDASLRSEDVVVVFPLMI
jgi:hypothetical protein